MDTVRAYADAVGVQPTTVIQRAAKVGGATWSKWEAGRGSPTLRTADKILNYIADNPPKPRLPLFRDDRKAGAEC